MALNGKTVPVIVGVLLTALLAWTTYVTNRLAEVATKTAVVETKLAVIDRQLDRIEALLRH